MPKVSWGEPSLLKKKRVLSKASIYQRLGITIFLKIVLSSHSADNFRTGRDLLEFTWLSNVIASANTILSKNICLTVPENFNASAVKFRGGTVWDLYACPTLSHSINVAIFCKNFVSAKKFREGSFSVLKKNWVSDKYAKEGNCITIFVKKILTVL